MEQLKLCGQSCDPVPAARRMTIGGAEQTTRFSGPIQRRSVYHRHRAFEESTMNQVSISDYKEKYRYTIYTEDNTADQSEIHKRYLETEMIMSV